VNGVRDVIGHPWFSDIKIEELLQCKIGAPFKPKLSGNALDVTNFDKQFTNEDAIVSMVPQQSAKVMKKSA
jgi:hypothetical protein